MKAEISHHGFAGQESYSGVYLQQGTMITDRDWNALCDRLKQRIDMLGSKTAGTGTPKSGGLLTDVVLSKPATPSYSARFAEAGGLLVAAGVCANPLPGNREKTFSYQNQKDLPGLEELAAPSLLYVDVWERTVTAFDERDLLDPGLHGAHTCFVSQTMAQIKRCTKEHLVETSCGLAIDPKIIPEIGNGHFDVALRTGSADADNCDPCAEMVEIDQNVGNYLFRVEVHDVIYDNTGQAGSVVLKWSGENGAIQYPRPEDMSSLETGYAYEFFTDHMELLAGIPAGGFADQPERGTLANENLSATDLALDRVRRWDGYAELDLTSGGLTSGWDRGTTLSEIGGPDAHGLVSHKDGSFTINLERLEIRLALGESDAGRPDILVGDYWLALARTRAAETDRIRVLSPLPIGVRHRYCLLGLCDSDGVTFSDISPNDMRRLRSPDLSCIEADDIRYDNTGCAYAMQEKAFSVQEALDAFCKRLQPPYHALRMSQGTGQEGAIDSLLPGPVEVVVEDQNGQPVKGVGVTFSAQNPVENGKPLDRVFETASIVNPKALITVETDERGFARAFWQINKLQGLHALEARLEKPVDGRTAATVTFAALAEKQAATSKLPLIKNVVWADGSQFSNDAGVKLDTLFGGFIIQFSEPMNRQLISNDVVTLHAEVPDRVERQFNFVDTIVCGSTKAGESEVIYTPNKDSVLDLFDKSPDWSSLPECRPVEGMRFRIRLLGRFLFSEDKRRLDGFVPGMPEANRVALDFSAAGIGHPSDFEAWFYSRPDSESRVNVNTATVSELQTRLGISRANANKIVSGRPWRRVDDVVNSGIDTRLRQFSGQLTVR